MRQEKDILAELDMTKSQHLSENHLETQALSEMREEIKILEIEERETQEESQQDTQLEEQDTQIHNSVNSMN